MPSEFTLSEAPLADALPPIPGPPPSTNLGPSALIDKQKLKARWGERYTSDAVNKKFLGIPRGVYFGFVPSSNGLTLTLSPDVSISYTGISGGPVIGESISGGTSSASADIRVISPGFFLLNNLFGTFEVGETITGGTSGFTATVTSFLQEGISFARVTSNTPDVAGRSDDSVDIMTTDTITIDFTGFTDGVYYVYATGSYKVGSTTIGTVSTRTTPPPNRVTEILVCVVTKIGTALTIQATFPASRQEPFASVGQRIGFMPGGSVEALLDAILTTQEVIASRQATDGTVAPAFSLGSPQTTGLPKRLADDLSRQSMASRLGKKSLVVRGNDVSVAAPITAPLNVSGSFAARTRDYQPFRDVTNDALPSGVPVPIVLDPDASDNFSLVLTGIVGAFGVGETLVGASSGAQAIVRSVSGSTLEINEIVGVFRTSEVVSSAGPPPGSGTISSISNREGVITAPESGPGGDPERNLVSVVDTYTGRKPVDANGNAIYGRLLFGPNGTSGPGGGSPGELLVATGVGEQINFVQSSTTVTNNLINFTLYFLPGDIIEGADGRFYEISPLAGSVTSTTLTLTAGKPYLGPNASATNRRRRRYLLRFVSKSGGVETQQTITPGTTIPSGSSIRPFFQCWLSGAQSNYDAQLDMRAPGEAHALATSSIPGVGYNAPGLGGGAGTGSPVIGAIRTIQQAGSPVGNGNFHTINLTAGSASGAAGVLTITAAGPTGPPGPGGGSTPGPPGPTGLGFSTIYAYQTQEVTINAFGITTSSINFNFAGPMRFYMVNSAIKLASGELDTGSITGVTATSGNTFITVNYRLDGGGGGLGQIIVFGAAACG